MLASLIAAAGIPVVLLVFPSDIALDCTGARAMEAAAAFPRVRSWILAGHSLGGQAALQAVGALDGSTDVNVAGVVLVASYSRIDLNCSATHPGGDLSGGNLSVLQVTATEDYILNSTNLELAREYLPSDSSSWVSIEGGNHGQFGHYDASGRIAAIGPWQQDGNATISNEEQVSVTAGAIIDFARGLGATDCRIGITVTSGARSPVMYSWALLIAVCAY